MEECDDCGDKFNPLDDGTNPYIFKCAKCYDKFLSSQDSSDVSSIAQSTPETPPHDKVLSI